MYDLIFIHYENMIHNQEYEDIVCFFENYATKVIIPIHGFYCVSVTVHAIIRGIIRYLQALIIILYILYPYVLAHGIQCQPKAKQRCQKRRLDFNAAFICNLHPWERDYNNPPLCCTVQCSACSPLSLLHSDAFVPKTVFLHSS